MRAHDNLPDATVVIASRNNVFKVTRARSPNVTLAAAEFFKPSAHNRVRPESIKDRSIGLIVDLRLHRLIVFRSRKSKLSRDQMLSHIQHGRRRPGTRQRKK